MRIILSLCYFVNASGKTVPLFKKILGTKLLLSIFFIVPFYGLTYSEVSANESAISGNNIVVLGDSLSAAYGINIDDGWVELLNQRLSAHANPKLHDFVLINAAISGDTSASGASRVDSLISKHQPSIVIIALGGNDGLRGLPLASIESNLETMIFAAKNSGAKVILAEMKIPPNYGQKYTTAFTNIYSQLADKQSLILMPFMLEDVATLSQYMQVDGIHPNTEAQPFIANNVWVTLEPTIKKLMDK